MTERNGTVSPWKNRVTPIRDELWEGEAERLKGRYNSFESFIPVLLPFCPWGGTSQRQ
jgi:hypothetical protein